MSTTTKPPSPIRIRRIKPAITAVNAPEPPPVATPPPKPAPQAKPLQALAQLVTSLEKPKGPATRPRKPRPPLIRVENPRRLQRQSKEYRKLGGMIVCSPAWGSPFRTREVDARWLVVWVGDQMRLGEYKPASWVDISCESRQEAAQLCQEAFRDWITSPAQSKLLDHARAILRGYNLVCFCPAVYPCHGDVLLDLANEKVANND